MAAHAHILEETFVDSIIVICCEVESELYKLTTLEKRKAHMTLTG